MLAGELDALSSMVSHNQTLIMKHQTLAFGVVVMSIFDIASPTCMPEPAWQFAYLFTLVGGTDWHGGVCRLRHRSRLCLLRGACMTGDVQRKSADIGNVAAIGVEASIALPAVVLSRRRRNSFSSVPECTSQGRTEPFCSEIQPVRIARTHQRQLLCARPPLDPLFSLNRQSDLTVWFEVDEPRDVIARGERGRLSRRRT
jgi:hypothetical protein